MPIARRMVRCAVAVACLAAGGVSTLAGQEVRGTVRDSATRQPIAGAVLALLDASGATLGRNVTNQQGQYRIALSGGMQRIRVLRIGFRPREVRIPAPVDGVALLDITMAMIPTLLEPVRVRDDARCSRRDDRPAAFGLWEQARAGLLAAVVARDLADARMVRISYRRTIDASDDRIVSQTVSLDTADKQPKPFSASHSAAAFMKDGFVERVDGDWMFNAPDADVLLDEPFAESYCFHLMDLDRARPGQIGLGFLPATRQRGRVDVEGALWIDTLTRSLSDIEFRYSGLDRSVERYRPGGRVAFREMPNGLVVIDRWSLRLVGTRLDTIGRSRSGAPITRSAFIVTETGGEVARASWPDSTQWKASLGELRLRLVKADGAASARTRVQLPNTSYAAVTDSLGDIVMPDLLPGPYAVAIEDSLLVPLHLRMGTSLRFFATRDSVHRVTFVAPTVMDFVRAQCQMAGYPVNGPGWLLARVMDRAGAPIAGMHWTIRQLHATYPADPDPARLGPNVLREGERTRADGLIPYCGDRQGGPPRGARVQISVWRDGATPIDIDVSLDERLTIVPITWTPR